MQERKRSNRVRHPDIAALVDRLRATFGNKVRVVRLETNGRT